MRVDVERSKNKLYTSTVGERYMSMRGVEVTTQGSVVVNSNRVNILYTSDRHIRTQRQQENKTGTQQQ